MTIKYSFNPLFDRQQLKMTEMSFFDNCFLGEHVHTGHVTYQSKAHEQLYLNTSIKCSFDPLFDRQQLKITGN